MATSQEATARQPDAPGSAQHGGYAILALTAKPPAPLNVEDRAHRGENWRRFERDWKIYEQAAKISIEAPKVRVAALLNIIGHDALGMYDTFDWGDHPEHKDNIEKVLEQFRNRLVPESTETFERYKFFKRNQELEEIINAYVTAVMKLADSCNFGTLKDSHSQDRLVHGILDDSVRFKLLGKKQLSLAKCLEIL